MGAVTGGRLAAAVSNAGGLGLVGGGYGDPEWLRTELRHVQSQARRAWGVGFITWSLRREVLELALEHRPAAVMLSFGDPAPFAGLVKAAGCALVCQVQDLAGARSAVEAGADVVVAQGAEAGGHGGSRGTLALVPAVVDTVAPIPVLAAGGIADGRGLAAALLLGAQGALIGTRFYASVEALAPERAKERIVGARGDDTVRTRIFDVVRRLDWPAVNTGRAIRNRFVSRWHGREQALEGALAREAPAYQEAVRNADYETAVVWAGEAIDLVHGIERAESIVVSIGAEAQRVLASANRLIAAAAPALQ
jgi:nitronate monooxygenase